MDRTSEYQGGHSAVSDKQQKMNEFESSAMSHHDIESQKSSCAKEVANREKAIAVKNRLPSSENRNSSERKLSSHSRPNTSMMTQPTRHSSAFLKKKKRNTLLTN